MGMRVRMAKGRVRKDGMRVGESRWSDGERWCGNSHWRSCSPHPVLLPAAFLQCSAWPSGSGCWLHGGGSMAPLFDLLMLELFPSHSTHLLRAND